MKKDYIMKAMNYKGNVVASWKIPKTPRQVAGQMFKLVKLYYRCKEKNLLTKDIITLIKRYAETLFKYAETTVCLIKYPELAKALREIIATKEEEYEEEIVAEKIRRHILEKCSLCNTELKYPAYVVYKKGQREIKVSAPIGIFCLTRLVGKLNDLITKIEVNTQVNLNDLVKKSIHDEGGLIT